MLDALTSIHRAFISFNKRAERSSEDILVETFVDSAPLYDILSAQNNQVIYGRRGTGKTHALKYLAEKVRAKNCASVYIDLRSIGSNGSIYNDPQRALPERAASLIIDVLNAIYNSLYEISLAAIDEAIHPEQITLRLDDFGVELSKVRVYGTVESVPVHSFETPLCAYAAIGIGLICSART